jgi:hypothetical protein
VLIFVGVSVAPRLVVGQNCPTIEKRNVPSRGEKPPLRINSRSQSCLSVRTIAGSFSASAASFEWRRKSLARRSLLRGEHLELFNGLSPCLLEFSAMWRVCHGCNMNRTKGKLGGRG